MPLSYPSIESYTILNFDRNSYNIQLTLGKDAKNFIAQRLYIQLNRLSEETLFTASTTFLECLRKYDLTLDTDYFSETSEYVF